MLIIIAISWLSVVYVHDLNRLEFKPFNCVVCFAFWFGYLTFIAMHLPMLSFALFANGLVVAALASALARVFEKWLWF